MTEREALAIAALALGEKMHEYYKMLLPTEKLAEAEGVIQEMLFRMDAVELAEATF